MRPIIFLKATIAGGAARDLFATPTHVEGYTNKQGTYVAPHMAIRHKHMEEADAPAPAPAPTPPTVEKPATVDLQTAVGRALGPDRSFTAEDLAQHWGRPVDEVLDLLHADHSGFAVAPNGRWMRMADYLDATKPMDSLAHVHSALSNDETEAHLRPRLEEQARRLTEAAIQNASDTLQEPDGAELLSDDPSSPNYRYRDTGYVAGSRKEMAAAVIKQSARDGRQVLPTQIDWSELEQNPREAHDLITKSNLFGSTDWNALRDAGMEPGAGFLIDRVYASIGQAPDDTSQARQDFALGLQTIRARLEECKTAADVALVLEDIGKERQGTMMNAEESRTYSDLSGFVRGAFTAERQYDDVAKPLYDEAQRARAAVYPIEREVENRKTRKWAPKPELDEKLAAARELADRLWDQWSTVMGENRPKIDALRQVREKAGKGMNALMEQVKARNAIENPLHRAWGSLGERFVAAICYRSAKGSDAFAKHVAAAKSGKIKDWSWAEKETTRAPRITKESTRFQLTVPDTFKRVGGRDVPVASTVELKDRFGLRDVQSGNWVLRDQASAKWHTEQAALGMADLADVIGAQDGQVAFNGRLALAFGARGHGSAGFQSGAPMAHYEPVQRVINITKMRGGGSLAHEWFHALDNMLPEAEGGRSGTAKEFFTADPALLPAGKIRDAAVELRSAMFDGTERETEAIGYTRHHVRMAALNVTGNPANVVARKIKAAPDVHAAVQAVDDHFGPDGKAPASRKMKQLARDWRTIAVAHHDANPEGAVVEVRGGPAMSSYALNSARLDDGGTTYWSETEEMAARAFQSYVEDKLAGMGRQNDYLSSFADNKYHMNGKPYPEGSERARINLAFDQLFGALADANSLAKCLALLDAYWKAGQPSA